MVFSFKNPQLEGLRTPRPWTLLTGPAIEAPTTATSTISYPTGNDTLAPPPAGVAPGIPATKAVAVAEGIEDVTHATSITSTFGLYTDASSGVPVDAKVNPTGGSPQFVNVPAWSVTVECVCIPYYGGFSTGGEVAPASGCAGAEANIVIDASTGKFLEEFSYR